MTCREITLDGLYNTSKSFLGASGVVFDHVAGRHHHHSAVKHVVYAKKVIHRSTLSETRESTEKPRGKKAIKLC
jgi:hypothetical protein